MCENTRFIQYINCLFVFVSVQSDIVHITILNICSVFLLYQVLEIGRYFILKNKKLLFTSIKNMS